MFATISRAQQFAPPMHAHKQTFIASSFIDFKGLFPCCGSGQETLNILASVEAGHCKIKQVKNKEAWDRTVATVARIPKYWMAEWLASSDTSSMPLTQKLLDLMDFSDTQNVPRVFCMVTMVSMNTPLPGLMRNSKALCAKTFKARLASLKNPLVDWAQRHVQPHGAINWATGGAYKLTWDDAGKATQVTHICGDTVEVDSTITITKEYELCDPWDHFKARVEKNAARYYFHEMFGAGQGPHPMKLDKKATILDNMAAEGAKEMEEAVRAVGSHDLEGDTEYVGQSVAKKRKDDLKAMQEKAKESMKRRRVVKLMD